MKIFTYIILDLMLVILIAFSIAEITTEVDDDELYTEYIESEIEENEDASFGTDDEANVIYTSPDDEENSHEDTPTGSVILEEATDEDDTEYGEGYEP